MPKQIIGLDLDGVIVDNTKNKIKFAKKFGFELKPEDTPAEHINQVVPEKILTELKKLLYHDLESALQATLMLGAQDGLEAIKNSAIPYFLISRRKDPEIAIKLLQKRGLWPRYFNEENTFFVLEPEDKNVKAVELGVSVYVDDEPSVLSKLVNVEKRILFDRFQKFSRPTFAKAKVSSWKELLTHLL